MLAPEDDVGRKLDDLTLLRRLPRSQWPTFIARLPQERKEAVYNALQAAVTAQKYADDPVGYIENVLGERLWSKQKEAALAIRDHRRVALPSSHSSGKTHFSARITLWWCSAHPIGTALAVTTGNIFRQVKTQMWPHIRRIHEAQKLPGRTNLTEWWIGEELVAYAFCYDEATEVLTDAGWKRFQDLDGTESVATRDPNGFLEFQKPTAYIDEPYEGTMIRFKNRMLSALVTPNHKMLVKRSPGKGLIDQGLQLLPAERFTGTKLSLQPYRVPAVSQWIGVHPERFTLKGTDPNKGWINTPWTEVQLKELKRFYQDNQPPLPLPIQEMCSALEKTPREISKKAQKLGISAGLGPRSKTRHVSSDLDMPMEVWAAFLGLYLSEGWCGKDNIESLRQYRENSIFICQSVRSRHLPAIENILSAMGGLSWSYNKKREVSGAFRTSHQNLATWLRQQCYIPGADKRAWNKRVPSDVFNWSPHLLNIFIDHLMIGDGRVESNGFRRYLTTSPYLADDLMIIAQKAGIEGSIRPRMPMRPACGRRLQYTVNLRRDEHHLLPTGKPEFYRGRIGCVTVPNGTLYVRRDGNAMWCGNSAADSDPEAVHGIHAPHLLILVDESGGIPHVIGQAFEGLMSSGDVHIVLLGNPPVDEEGTWFEQCASSERWYTINLSAEVTPNWTGEETGTCTSCPATVAEHSISSHLVSKEWAQELADDFGEDSPMYQSKVLAQFPKGTASKAIPYSWVEAARDNHYPWGGTSVRLGIDVASDGGDEVVVAKAVGNTVTIQYTQAGEANSDPVQVAGKLLEQIREAEIHNEKLGNDAPVRVKIDSLGLGWGVYGLLKTWGEEGKHSSEIIEVQAGNKATEADRYCNVRAELWWTGRKTLSPQRDEKGNLLNPQLRLDVDRKTSAQLSTPNYRVDSQGRILIESKKDMRKRGVKSPDRAEGILLALYEPPPPQKKRKARLIL